MNNAVAQHVKSQLQTLRQSDSLDYSKGLIDGLLAYLDAVCPETITIEIIGPKGGAKGLQRPKGHSAIKSVWYA